MYHASSPFKYEKYYVYTILSLNDFEIYTGLTTDLKMRLDEHTRGLVSASKIRVPFKLIHYEYFVNIEDAKKKENFLKSNVGKAQLKESLKNTLHKHLPQRYHMYRPLRRRNSA